jgi:hypothetical protein
MSAAISFYTTFQQLMLSLGICFAATVLHVSAEFAGHERVMPSDFSITFAALTFVSLLAVPVCARLAEDAGEDMSGYRLRMEARQLLKGSKREPR